MSLFNSSEDKKSLSTHQAEPISEPHYKPPNGDGDNISISPPKESEYDVKNGKTPTPTREKPGNTLQDSGDDGRPADSVIMPPGTSTPNGTGELVPVADSAVVDVDARLKLLARQIAGSKKKLVANVLAIGEALTEAQDLLASHHGGVFGKWVKQNCGFSKRTAYRYMSAQLTFGSCAPVAQRRFELSTMYILAHDSTPPAAVTEAIEIAESGETVTSKTAHQLIAKHGDGKPARKVSTRPEPILYDDPDAIVTVHAKHPGVDHGQVLARVFKKIMGERKAREAA